MRRIVYTCAAAIAFVFPASASAEDIVAGPGESLTGVVTIPAFSPTGSKLYGFNGTPRTGFAPPTLLSEAGDEAADPSLAVDDNGDVLAVWSAIRNYPQLPPYQPKITVPRGVWYSWRPAGGTFSAPRQVNSPAPGQTVAIAAMDGVGDAAVGYDERGSVYLRWAHANGQFGPPTKVISGSLTPKGPTSALDYLGFDRGRELMIVGNGPGDQLRARFYAHGRTLGTSQVITSATGSQRPKIAMGENGAATIAWEAPPSGIFAVYRRRGGKFGARQRLVGQIKPRSGQLPAVLENGVINRSGQAVYALLGSGDDIAAQGDTEAIEWSGHGTTPERTRLGGAVTSTVGLAENGAGETAISYGEFVSSERFRINLRFNAIGDGFGVPHILAEGPNACSINEATFKEPLCEGVPDLIGDSGRGFYAASGLFATSGFSALLPPSGGPLRIRMRRVSETVTGAFSDLILPESTTTPRQVLAPSSIIDFGESATVDKHVRIHGEGQCGTEEGSCSVQMWLIEAKRTLGHANVLFTNRRERGIVLALNRTGRRRLALRGRLTAQVVTRTTGSYGSTLGTTYPLTVQGAGQR